MNFVRPSSLVFICIVIAVSSGCKAKEDKSAASQEKAASPAASAPDKTVTPAASPQDQADARAAALQVLSNFEAGEFSQIYKGASEGFKKIGTEPQFVAKFQQTRLKTGLLKNPKETSFTTRPGNNIVLFYQVENERYKTEMRMTFARGKSGRMELAGLNQHDELKK